MAKYELEEGKGLVREEEEAEEKEGGAEEMKSVLGEAMREAWQSQEARAMKRKLSKLAKAHWKPQIEEALKVTGYKKELAARAKEIDYSGKVRKVWE